MPEQEQITPAQSPVVPAAAAKSAEPQTNCPVCNKSIKRLTRYYRDGKFYCAKKCWRQLQEKSKEEKSKEEKQ